MTEKHHYPNIPQSIWILISLSLLMLVLGVFVGILESFLGFPPADHPALLALLNLVAFGLILIVGLKRAKTNLTEICPLRSIRLSLLFPMALTVFGASILISESDNLLRTVLPPPTWFSDYIKSLVSAEISLWGSILSLVVIAPLTEELLVRGLILRGFLSHYSARKAILASAIFFALLHLNPWQFIGATALGILFGWWFIETRSMLPCLFGHAFANALPLAATVLLPFEISGYTSDFGTVKFHPLWFDLVGLISVVLGIWLLIRQFRKSGDTVPEDVPENSSHQL